MSTTGEPQTKPQQTAEMGAKLLAFSSIPVIDIAALSGDDRAAFEAAARKIAEACETVGFFYIKNHGVPEALIERAYTHSRAFHCSDEALKRQVHVSRSPGSRGWVPLSDEDGDPNPYYVHPPEPGKLDHYTRPRLHETFDLAIEIADDDPDFLAGNVMLVPNQWPEWIPQFREDIITYYNAVQGVGANLFRAFAFGLGLPDDYFVKLTTKTPSQLRLLHYPPNEQPMDDSHFGIRAHSDFECFTVLHQNAPGLQVMNAADEWVAAPPIEGTFIVNIGDMLEGWTNGRFKATQHRVVNTGKDRYSMPLFFAVDYHTEIEPLPQFVSEANPSKYSKIVAGDHLASFSVQLTRHLRKKVVLGELKVDFPLPKDNPFKRIAVNEYQGPNAEAAPAPAAKTDERP